VKQTFHITQKYCIVDIYFSTSVHTRFLHLDLHERQDKHLNYLHFPPKCRADKQQYNCPCLLYTHTHTHTHTYTHTHIYIYIYIYMSYPSLSLFHYAFAYRYSALLWLTRWQHSVAYPKISRPNRQIYEPLWSVPSPLCLYKLISGYMVETRLCMSN